MGKYIKLFETHAEYQTYINSSDKILPNVSYCEDNNDVHYNPWTDPRLIVKYLVEDATNPTQLYKYIQQEGMSVVGSEIFDKVEINNVEVSISDLDTAEGKYQFSISGEHTVKYTLNDPTLIGVILEDPTDPSTMTVGATFMQCGAITSVEIPNSVTTIGYGSFSQCNGLTSITIPNSVTSIGESAFDGCSGLTSVTIPNSVTTIGNKAFYGCTGLTNVTISDSVTTIGNKAFQNCTGLTSVIIPDSVTTIGGGAFYGCTGLTNVTISDSVTTIGGGAFNGCTGLTNVIIPNSVTTIGGGAFNGCTGLTSITIQATTPPTLDYFVFGNTNNNCPIYVPSASVAAYKAASGWSDYASRIQAIP